MRRAWFWLVILAACEEAQQPKQGSAVVMVDDSDPSAPIVVTAPWYELELADARYLRLPTALRIGELNKVDVLGGSGGCPAMGEDLVGIAMYPLLTASSSMTTGKNNALDPTVSAAQVDWRGPGVVKVTVTYTIPYQCSAANALTGSSVFTMFPYGRISRVDTVAPSTASLDTAESCGHCAALDQPAPIGGNFFFASYYMFAQPAVFFDHDGATQIAPGAAAPSQACVETRQRRVAVAWQPAVVGTQGYRINQNGSYTFDWTRGTATIAPTMQTEASNIVVEDLTVSGVPSCGELIDLFADDPPLVIDGEAAEVRPDGTYKRSSPVTSPITLTAPDRAINHGLAIELPLAIDSLHHVHVFREGGGASAYVLQRLAADTTLIYIDDSLELGQRSHIEYD